MSEWLRTLSETNPAPASAATSAGGRTGAFGLTTTCGGVFATLRLCAGGVATGALAAGDAAFAPGPNGWCLITTGGEDAELALLRPINMNMPPSASAAARPTSAAIRTGGDTDVVMSSLSAPRTRD